MKANIFIVWGGNKKLADRVSEKLQEQNEFNVQVGGEDSNSMFIGTTVLNQIQRSSIAIILVQNSDKSGDGLTFRPNLMFEWGYIIANFKPQNVHVFLIDMEEKNLPSDLRGSWAKSIWTENKSIDQIAQEIAIDFRHNYHEQNIDKLETFENWSTVKANIKEHTSNPIYTDREMAAIILYSFQAAYYYSDIKHLRKWILEIHSNDSVVEYVNKTIVCAIDYYISKENINNSIATSELLDIIDRLDDEYDISLMDKEINKWLHIIAYNFRGLCNNRLWDLNPKKFEAYRSDFLSDALNCFMTAIDYLGNDNDVYSDIWRGYIFRNIAVVYAKKEDNEHMIDYMRKAQLSRKRTKDYFSTNTTDPFLINYFKLEYIMIQLEYMKFTRSIDELKLIVLNQQMKQLDLEFSNQNILYTNIRKLLDSINALNIE